MFVILEFETMLKWALGTKKAQMNLDKETHLKNFFVGEKNCWNITLRTQEAMFQSRTRYPLSMYLGPRLYVCFQWNSQRQKQIMFHRQHLFNSGLFQKLRTHLQCQLPPQAKRHDGSPNCTCTIVASSDLIVAPGYASLHTEPGHPPKLTKSHFQHPNNLDLLPKIWLSELYFRKIESNWIENYVFKQYVLDIVYVCANNVQKFVCLCVNFDVVWFWFCKICARC